MNALAAMSNEQYALLIFRILFSVTIGFAAILGSVVAFIKASKYLWDTLMNHIRESISGTYCTPAQLTTAVAEIKLAVTDGFSAGEARFASTESRIALLEKRPVCRLQAGGDCPIDFPGGSR